MHPTQVSCRQQLWAVVVFRNLRAMIEADNVAAAEERERQRAIEPTAERTAALEKSLATLVGMLEEMTPDVEREA